MKNAAGSEERLTFRYSQRMLEMPFPSAVGHAGDAISFAEGDAYPPDMADMTASAVEALTTRRSETLQYAPRAGLPDLRRWVTDYLAKENVRVTPENVLIVNGAKHGLDLACKLFLNPGDAVIVTAPTYMTALPILRSYGPRFIQVRQDSEGLLVDEVEAELRACERNGGPFPKIIYNVFEFHNPTGVTTSEPRRARLLDLAERYNVMIVEDDPYRRIRFEGEPVPPVQALDRANRVIGLGTFAKIIAPGLRVGWVTAAPEIVRKMAVVKSDGGTCPLTQRMIVEYCRAGQLEPHIKTLVKTYEMHRDVMLEMLAKYLPEATTMRPSGGYYLWIQMPEDIDTDHLLPLAQRHGVRYLPGSRFYAAGGPRNYLRLAYSFSSVEEIQEGMRRLAAAVSKSRKAEGPGGGH
ncbi:MAG: hypothetical protein A3G80_06100 [Betaproteobacteria bacterium RIFCSPLOWO2_12_FULL_62_13b]|nr:MAG: hypothetical protein A3G80_06100 [Betaproteobacteria bacterium RIFCSPLOWO2_12_FULL_62_13b]OGB94388.1 MAG: hypothetical protein A3H39_11220 [candidate division NC10 bacterium RIFCSPLOWO2_02_FULL_66_22]